MALPAVADFEPELIVLSSGQDAGACDPLGRMSVTAEGFRGMTAGLVSLSEEQCDGRIVAIQEGGYSVDHMPFCVLATVEALAGLEPALDGDPVEMDVPTGIAAGTKPKRSATPPAPPASPERCPPASAVRPAQFPKSTRLQSSRSGNFGRPSSGTGYQAGA